MTIVIDATTAPPVDAMRAAGVVGLCRYLSWLYRWGGTTHTYINPKVIQRPEFDRLHAAGFDIALNWEYDAADWLGGSSAGTAHAAEAVRQAHALGYPAGRVIIGSADFDMTASQWSGAGRAYAAAFSAGVLAGGYLPGVYGPWDVLTWCRDAGLMRVFWQAGMSTAWSGGRNASPWPGAHLRQRRQIYIGGVDCDANDILIADYGQYRAGATLTGDDMLLRVRDGGDLAGTPAGAIWAATPAGPVQVRATEYTGPVTTVPVMLVDSWTRLCQYAPAAAGAVQLTPEDRDAIAAGVAEQLAGLIPTVVQVADEVAGEVAARLANG